jgi:hypothetical protein
LHLAISTFSALARTKTLGSGRRQPRIVALPAKPVRDEGGQTPLEVNLNSIAESRKSNVNARRGLF